MKQICQWCKKEFDAPPSGVERGRHKYCSVVCYSKSRDTRIIKTCSICGEEYQTSLRLIRMGRGKFCSKECSIKASHDIHQPTQICEQCGKSFKTELCWVKRGGGRFCSRECSDKHRTTSTTKTCLECGQEFSCHLSRIKNGGGLYCSLSCSSKSESRKEKLRIASSSRTGELASNWKGGTITNTCIHCGKTFARFPCRIRDGMTKFCSSDCANNHNKKFGEESHSWKGGISFEPYCPKFNNEFRERVRAFFYNQCAECGEPQTVKKLHVHHVNFNKESCCAPDAPRLFVPLCDRCHGRSNHNRIFWEYWFTEMINHLYGGKCYLPKETPA